MNRPNLLSSYCFSDVFLNKEHPVSRIIYGFGYRQPNASSDSSHSFRKNSVKHPVPRLRAFGTGCFFFGCFTCQQVLLHPDIFSSTFSMTNVLLVPVSALYRSSLSARSAQSLMPVATNSLFFFSAMTSIITFVIIAGPAGRTSADCRPPCVRPGTTA